MNTLKESRPRLTFRGRYDVWRADLVLRHKWYRVLLHLCGIVRCPRNFAWHRDHIRHEFHERKRRL